MHHIVGHPIAKFTDSCLVHLTQVDVEVDAILRLCNSRELYRCHDVYSMLRMQKNKRKRQQKHDDENAII